MGQLQTIHGYSDEPIYVDEPVDFSYETTEDETGNNIRFNLVDRDDDITEIDTINAVSDGSVGTVLTVTKDPTDDLGITTGGYYTVQVIRNPSGSDDTLDEARIYLTERQ